MWAAGERSNDGDLCKSKKKTISISRRISIGKIFTNNVIFFILLPDACKFHWDRARARWTKSKQTKYSKMPEKKERKKTLASYYAN